MRVFDRESVRCKHGCREILEIGRNDYIGLDACCRRDDMAVVGIGQLDCRDEFLVARNQSVPDVGVHESARTVEAGSRDVRPATPQRTGPLVVVRS